MSLMVLSIGNEGVSISTVGEWKVSTSGHIKQSEKLYFRKWSCLQYGLATKAKVIKIAISGELSL